MIQRRLISELKRLADAYPATVLLGPRQVGKTTLARIFVEERPSIYLDLESDTDRRKLADPETYLRGHAGEVVVLDEVQRMPDLFRTLRSVIDADLPQPRRNGQFLLLGSASLDLLAQADESLAGRVAHLELYPLDVLEVGEPYHDALWLRGGYPESFTAASDRTSFELRADLIASYLERDVPQLGVRIPAETLKRFFVMLAHYQGTVLNAAALARALGVDGKTIAHYLDLAVDLLLVRRLAPWHANTKKRLVKSPKVYVRDSGLLHTLLGIGGAEALAGHPVRGHSWEGFVIEQTHAVLPRYSATTAFFRTATGDEIDLVVDVPGVARIAVEVKASSAAHHSAGFLRACDVVEATHRFVVYRGVERFTLSNGVEAVSLADFLHKLVTLTTP